MSKSGRTVSQRGDGTWANQKDGGELKVKNEDGKIRQKDTIAPAIDPYPPKG